MKSAEIRRSFLEFFRARGHEVLPSGPLAPANDPTLLFVNAGMAPFKAAFLGAETPPAERVATAQKCVRAGGKHNDLEEVGRTARHHTFFEMLGNFSFGDYFKRRAIECAWKFLVAETGIDPDRLFVTVHRSDGEAARLWSDIAGVPANRIHALGDRDNFWQMADTGPCGPCSEIHYDLRPRGERGSVPGLEEFEARSRAGEFLELWNLVFMQFDRDESGTLRPLPAPSIDTGLGLERLAAVLQGVDSNFHTDLFLPLLDRVAETVGRPYRAAADEGVSYRVLADHARAVVFLLADDVFPSNEGRGYVLRRILRRGVRHAWLLGRREPTLVDVAERAIETMADAYPELAQRRDGVLALARGEEERFLATVEGGMSRFAAVAPELDEKPSPRPTIPGAEVFRLYDTFGFPADLTRVMAAERGYDLDMDGFERSLAEQRRRSRAAGSLGPPPGGSVAARGDDATAPRDFDLVAGELEQTFVGHDRLTSETRVVGVRDGGGDGAVDLVLERSPFYVEGGGQVSDRGRVTGDGWRMDAEAVFREGRWTAVRGRPEGAWPGANALGAAATAQVDAERRRDVERNHTGTHLLHAALRAVLGSHAVQKGSLVAPDRLRFDFAHPAPLTEAELEAVQRTVNDEIRRSRPVRVSVRGYDEAVAAGAMALFGEKYSDRVRVVEIPGTSVELCGGTHVRRAGEVGAFAILSETGVAGGVRRVEAVTGRRAYERFSAFEDRIEALAASLGAAPDNLERKVEALVAENADLAAMLDDLRRRGDGGARSVVETEVEVNGLRVPYRGVRLKVRSADEARRWGDAFRESADGGVAVVAAEMPGERYALFAFASDRAVQAGLRADALVRGVAAGVGGRGGGRPHMAQAGVGNPDGIDDAIRSGVDLAGAAAP